MHAGHPRLQAQMVEESTTGQDAIRLPRAGQGTTCLLSTKCMLTKYPVAVRHLNRWLVLLAQPGQPDLQAQLSSRTERASAIIALPCWRMLATISCKVLGFDGRNLAQAFACHPALWCPHRDSLPHPALHQPGPFDRNKMTCLRHCHAPK